MGLFVESGPSKASDTAKNYWTPQRMREADRNTANLWRNRRGPGPHPLGGGGNNYNPDPWMGRKGGPSGDPWKYIKPPRLPGSSNSWMGEGHGPDPYRPSPPPNQTWPTPEDPYTPPPGYTPPDIPWAPRPPDPNQPVPLGYNPFQFNPYGAQGYGMNGYGTNGMNQNYGYNPFLNWMMQMFR